MPNLPKTNAQLKKERRSPRQSSSPRPTANERGYSYRWQKASKAWLVKHPLCRKCEAKGLATQATLVHHIVPFMIAGEIDSDLFWDSKNWMGLCKACHDEIPHQHSKGDAPRIIRDLRKLHSEALEYRRSPKAREVYLGRGGAFDRLRGRIEALDEDEKKVVMGKWEETVKRVTKDFDKE